MKCAHPKCHNEFIHVSGKKYCSKKCKQSVSRSKKQRNTSLHNINCKNCNKTLVKGQKYFCCNSCLKHYWNFTHINSEDRKQYLKEYRLAKKEKESDKLELKQEYRLMFLVISNNVKKCQSCGKYESFKRKFCKKCSNEQALKYKKRTIDPFYRSKQWRDIRKNYLSIAKNNICQKCNSLGKLNNSYAVDHIIPRRIGGSDYIMNLQGLCMSHHQSKSAQECNSISKEEIQIIEGKQLIYDMSFTLPTIKELDYLARYSKRYSKIGFIPKMG